MMYRFFLYTCFLMSVGCSLPKDYVTYWEEGKSLNDEVYVPGLPFDFEVTGSFLWGEDLTLIWLPSKRLEAMKIEVFDSNAESVYVRDRIVDETSAIFQIAFPGSYTVQLTATLKSAELVFSNPRVMEIVLSEDQSASSFASLASPQRGGHQVRLSYKIAEPLSLIDKMVLEVSYDSESFEYLQDLPLQGVHYDLVLPLRDVPYMRYRIVLIRKNGSRSIIEQEHAFHVDATPPVLPTVLLASSPLTQDPFIEITSNPCSDISRFKIADSLIHEEHQARYSLGCHIAPMRIALPLPSLVNGPREVYVWAVDAAGNISADYATLSFTLDTTAPVMSLGSAVPEFVRPNAAFNLGWTITEAQAVDSQSISIELSSNNSSTWTSLHTRSSPNGALVDEAMNQDLNYPSLTGVNHRLRIRMRDAAGNQGEVVSSMFRVDNDLPVLSSVIINDGALSTISNTVQMDFVATDATSAVESVRIVEKTLASCESLYADNQWLGYAPRRNVTLSPTNGEKILCVWVKDQAGNVSTLVGDGSLGVNTAKIQMDIGLPPSFTSLHVENNNPASPHYQTQTVEVGDSIRIAWSIEDAGGLATSPVKIEVTLNGTDFTTVASSVGSLGVGITIWSSEYTAYTATTSGFIRFKITAIDAVGNTKSMMSPSLNTGRWSVFAGSAGSGDGETALAARLGRTNGAHNQNILTVTADGSIYVSDTQYRAIRRINPVNGVINTYLKFGSSNLNIPGPVSGATVRSLSTGLLSIFSDYNHSLFLLAIHGSSRALFKVNTLDDTIEYFAGGGTSTTDGDLASNAQMANGAGFAFDYSTGEIYYFADCPTPNDEMIFKISRKEDGSADRIHHIAGDCSANFITNGVDAKSTSLRAVTGTHSSRRIAYDPNHNALYFHNSPGRIHKIINQKLYMVTESPQYGYDFGFNPYDNKIYAGRTGIRTITPTSAEAVEARVAIANHGTQAYLCQEDELLASESCLEARSFAFLPNGSILFTDGYSINGTSSFRIRRLDPDQRVRTVAGVKALTGHGVDRSASMFGRIRQIRYKKSTAAHQDIFPAGLYFGDGDAVSIGRIDPVDHKMYIMGGSQIPTEIVSGAPFAPFKHLSGTYYTHSAAIFNFDVSGLLYYNHAHLLYRVTADRIIQRVVEGGAGYIDVADGTPGSLFNLAHFGARAGLVFDALGRLFSGVGGPAAFAERHKIYYLDTADEHRIYKVIGGDTRVASTDDATPGSAVHKTLNCTYGVSECYVQYDLDNQRLLIEESTKIRFVTSPHDPSQSTLGTLMDAGRVVRAFHYIHDKQRVYYLSHNNLLYCYDLLHSSPVLPECNNAFIYSFGNQLGFLSAEGIAVGENNDLYVVAASGDVIFKYEIPD
jgi:hypothetical protein